MGMTGAGLSALRKQYKDAVAPSQTSDAVSAMAYADLIELADSQAIVDYITGTAKATGTDSHGDTHNLSIE